MLIHGKEYKEVKERIVIFREKYPDWSIITEVYTHAPDFSWVVFHAWLVNPDESQQFHGWAYEERNTGSSQEVNFAAWVENCETSAIGRAFANMGLTGGGERPSKEEMDKVERAKAAASTKSTVAGVVEKPKLVLRKAGEGGSKDLLTNIAELSSTIKKLMGHDQAVVQALINRGISDLTNVRSLQTLKDLAEALDNYAGHVEELASQHEDHKLTEEDRISLGKMALLL